MTAARDPLHLDHVIIGSGEAGTRAALALRAAGALHVTLIGDEPGLPYERPPLSKPEGDSVTIRPIAESLDGITTRFGIGVTGIDRDAQRVVLEDGSSLAYDRLLIATGARARLLPGVTRSLRNRQDAEAIFKAAEPGRHVAIIGAGLIGLELAAELRRRDVLVTVIEAAPHPLGRALPKALATKVAARHLAEGVRLIVNADITAIDSNRVQLRDEDIIADLVVAAIGVTPETALAEKAGLPCANGILVDAGLMTADPAIFAAGDCAAIGHPELGRTRFETWRNACDQGAMAARAMLGEVVRFTVQPWFWSDQYDLGIQMVGLHDPSRTIWQRDLPGGGFLLFETCAEGRLRAASGFAPGRAVAKDIRIAEMLIERGAAPSSEALCNPQISLKSLLHEAAARPSGGQG